MENLLRDGIVIFGERYHFFSASGSQLREHSSIFLKTESVTEVYNLRDEIVANQPDFRSVPKYLARLGLFSTADVPKGSVHFPAVGIIKDVQVSFVSLKSPSATSEGTSPKTKKSCYLLLPCARSCIENVQFPLA